MSYVFRQGDLPKLDLQVDRGTDFKAWKSQWGAYLSLSGLDKEIAAKQVQALTLCFSRETLTIVENLGLTAEQKSDITRTVDAIQRYVDGQINESVERRNFRRRIQQPGESFDDFLIALRELAKTCNFCTDECTQKNLRDQIIAGLVDGDTVESLLQKKELTLETTIAKCRAQEAAKRQRGEITGDNTGVVAAIRQQRRHEKPLTQSRTCPGCGASFHQGGRKHFPAYSLTCHLCGRSGHFAKVCRSRQPPQPLPETAPQPVTSTRAIHAVPQLHTSKVIDTIDPAPTVQVHITSLNGAADIQTLPDSGADISAAGPDALRHLGEHEDNLPSHIIPRAVNGTSMKPIGRLPVTFRLGRQTHVDHLHIYPSVKGVLLSWKTAKSLNILLSATRSHATHP